MTHVTESAVDKVIVKSGASKDIKYLGGQGYVKSIGEQKDNLITKPKE